LVRVFDAPRRLGFDAFTKPKLLKRRFGPRGCSLVVCEVDFRVGGAFRFVLRGPDGSDMGMRGVYRELVPPERSVHMESFDDYPGESQVTSVFAEQGGKTTLTVTVHYPSREVRTSSSNPAWSTVRPGPTTVSPSFWRQTVKRRTKCKKSPPSCGSTEKPKRR
jgi:uncharacterized protein YndB with AHSA1/START domain